MIKIHCHTNLDLAHEIWPTELPAVPRVGDLIQSATNHDSFQLTLKVVSVTWKRPFADRQWAPVVELHDYSSRTIREFYEWYAPLTGHNVSYFIQQVGERG